MNINCTNCTEKEIKLIPFQILPLIDKVSEIKERGYYFQVVWSHARQHINKAKKIIIIGYSISAADVHIKLFLKNNIVNSKNLEEVIFVVPSTTENYQERAADLLGIDDLKKHKQIIEPALKYKQFLIKDYLNKELKITLLKRLFQIFLR